MRFSSILAISLLCFLSDPLKAQNTCHGADVNSDHFIRVLNKMMAAEQSAFRAKLSMPLVTSTGISLASDPAICARAGAAVDSMVKVWLPNETVTPVTTPLYVIQVGTSYAVADLNSLPSGEYDSVMIFGPLWEYRGSIAM
jgi:hypothetical protein